MPVAHLPPRPRVLVAEDTDRLAASVCDLVVRCGCDVAGPVDRVETGLQFVRDNVFEAAVVDSNLQGAASFPLCEQLQQRDIPFLFLIGHERRHPVPEQFRTRPWLPKPVDDREFGVALAGMARAAAPNAGRGNLVLDRLAAADWMALQPLLEHVPLDAGDRLAGGTAHVHFPTAGLVTVGARGAHGGKTIEVALVGREGATGLEALLGEGRAAELESVVHFPGTAWRVPARALQLLVEARPGLRAELLAAVHALLGQVAQSAVSIGNGTIEQRLARRLLMASLRLASRDFALTHEALARVMAVRRSGVTVALHKLEARRVIRSTRNQVEILDYEGLLHLARGEGLARTETGALPSR